MCYTPGTTSIGKIFPALFFFAICLSAKGQFSENFQDGNLYENPIWTGDTAKFSVQGNKLVSASEVINDRFAVFTPVRISPPCQWEFTVNLQCNTSSLNYTDVHLISNTTDISGNNSGMLVRLGGTDDEICLYSKTAGTYLKRIDGRNGRTGYSKSQFRIRVICDSSRTFSLWVDSTATGLQYQKEGMVQDSFAITQGFFAIQIKQSTAAFFRKHFFDDLYAGPLLRDTTGPVLRNFHIASADSVLLVFSEPLAGRGSIKIQKDTAGAKVYNGTVNPDHQNPNAAIGILNDLLKPYQSFRMELSGFSDTAGNIMKDTQLNLIWEPAFMPGPFDVLISELLADPSPSVGLPDEEFVELYNSTAQMLELSGCRLTDENTEAVLPPCRLPAGTYLILCREEAVERFKIFGRVLGIKNMPSINNSGEILTLRAPGGKSIHSMGFDAGTYADPFKSEGGWSLEMVDTRSPCNPDNYKASLHPNGGTPGSPNSVRTHKPDTLKPLVTKVNVPDLRSIQIWFSEALDSMSAVKPEHYYFKDLPIQQLIYDRRKVLCLLSQPLDSGKVYPVALSGISDGCGNMIRDTAIEAVLPLKALLGSVYISEILFNPASGGADYLEICNRSDRIIALNDLILFNYDQNNIPENFVRPDTSGGVLFPHQFMAFTTNRQWVLRNYFHSEPRQVIQVSALPKMDDATGTIGLLRKDGLKLDSLYYHENIHFPLLTEVEGVALERLYMAPGGALNTELVSAAASYGYGTPGTVNSHSADFHPSGSGWLKIEPDFFTPDEDGKADWSAITVETECRDCQVSLWIFDASGGYVCRLANNVPAGNTQTWLWNGISESGRLAPCGIYVVMAELYGISGKTRRQKKTVTLGY